MVTDVAVWDYDDDQKAEIAFTTYSITGEYLADGRIYVVEFQNNSIPPFSLEWVSPVSNKNGFQSCIWFDYDEDGDEDLLFTSSVTSGNDGYVGVFENENGTLGTTMNVVSAETSWDPMDVLLCDCNFDDIIDVLVFPANDHPHYLAGQYSFAGDYSLNPQPIPISAIHDDAPNSFWRGALSDYNSDGYVDILVATENYVGEYISNPATRPNYTLESLTNNKALGHWISCEYGPVVSGDRTVISGYSWKQGIGGVIRENTDCGTLLEDTYVEFVSDMALVGVQSVLNTEEYYLAIAECGYLGSESCDPRTRNCRVNHWDESEESVFSECFYNESFERPDIPSEAFSTEWTSESILYQYTETFTIQIINVDKRLYCLSDDLVSSDFDNSRVVLNVTDATLLGSWGSRAALVHYLGNGLFFLATSPLAGESLSITILTTDTPAPVFGRRGSLEVHQVF